ncbi:type I restriction-modification system subunit M [Thiorhodovibrio frisius]|uniref:site-specific DNA-methyltransferase (adenine-specific) n=1 Tax=Thiorhodovibrio frisius TaxID=631362 RepID=H8Z0Z7_9GAMM|nr:class I SAM-dependent DNA methyltransferase [Thiorhodovibrio frisius]EIC22418.1 type I restriction-modification system methyltransferase subunit [Thiorhodovibrio frisius]WPL24718.1 putative type I restriction enzymeP M protein [Thiorhodovibrio frisius]
MAKTKPENAKSLESWIWNAACSIRGAKDAPKYKDYILPLIFTKRLCDVFDDELNRIAAEVGSRRSAFALVKADHKLVRFYLPLVPDDPEQSVWSVIRKLADRIGEGVTTQMRAIARENPLLQGIIDRVDFNATTHGQRDLDDDRLSNLIEAISTKRLGLDDVEADIIGKSYEYLIRKFAEGGGQSAGEFYTPPEVGTIMSRVLAPEPGMEIYDPCCGSGGLLIKCEIAMEESAKSEQPAPLKLYGQEYIADTWAMANMNLIIHDFEGEIEIGDTFKHPKFRWRGRLRTFDRVVANPMWNQNWFTEADYDNDELDRFPAGAGFPGKSSADWGWVQHMHASLNDKGRAAVVLDTGAASRGSGNAGTNKEKTVRQWFVDHDLIESVLYLPENLFYNTTAPGIVLFLNKAKPARRRGKVFLVNASQVFEKGDPKNFIPEAGIARIADTLIGWKEAEKLSRVVDLAELKKNDYNISPSRYIHTSDAETYRPLAEIVEELKGIEAEAKESGQALDRILKQLGIGA